MRSYWDEDLAILSAENVSFSIETAGLGSRFAALALDTFYQLLVWILLMLAAVGVERWAVPFSAMPKWMVSSLIALYSLITFALFFGYYFVFEWLWDGQTPGKRHFGLRVIQTGGLPLTALGSLSRNAVRIVDFLPFCYGFASIVLVSNPLSQRMGDLVAGTIVVRESKLQKERKPMTINEAVDAFLKAATTVPDSNTESKAFVEDEELRIENAKTVDPEAMGLAQKLSREDYELVRDFLVRRTALPVAAKDRLGKSLAARLAAKLGQEVPASQEAFLEEILLVLGRVYS
ncbi:RDD family protein [bacterium]|nr:MAG: RDD family protein [bacterium]